MKKRSGRIAGEFWERLFQGMSAKKKITVIFLLFACLPLLTTILIYYHYSMGIIENEVSQSVLKALVQTEDNLNFRMNMVAETASGAMASIYPYVSRDSESDTLGQQIDDFGTVSELASAYDGKNMIRKIRVFVSDDKLYAHQHDLFFGLSELSNRKTLLEDFDRGQNVLWLGTYSYEDPLGGKSDNVFSCVCMAKKLNQMNEFALVLYADVEESDVGRLLDLGMNYGESVSLVSGDGRILSHADKDRLGEKIFSSGEMAEIDAKKMGVMKGNSEDVVAFDRLDSTGWYLVAQVPGEKIYGTAKESFNITAILTVSVIFLILTLSTLLFYSFVMNSAVRRINRLTVQISREGAVALGSCKKKKNDLSVLEENVDSMMDTVRKLMEDSYRAKIVNREAQLKALQAQINPHFLYNTLDTIKWMVMDGENSEGVRMINSLSNYFRFSLSKGKDVVSIRNECDLCRTYLEIQQVRFGGKFTAAFDVQPDTLDCLIPKLTLQPVVENALMHGLIEKSGDAPGIITVTVSGGEDILIRVQDNGCGIDPARLKELTEGKSRSPGFGLHNVEERIRLFSGGGYGLKIESEPGKGTLVTIRLKRKTEIP